MYTVIFRESRKLSYFAYFERSIYRNLSYNNSIKLYIIRDYIVVIHISDILSSDEDQEFGR